MPAPYTGSGHPFITTQERETKLDPEDETPDAEATPSADAATDVSVYEAKIAELTGVIAERDAAIASLTADITIAKAANYDLLMNGAAEAAADNEPATPDDDPENVDVDDFFGED